MSQFHIFWTILLMAIFLGIIRWAWSSRRSADFEEAARLPLDDNSITIKPLEKEVDNG